MHLRTLQIKANPERSSVSEPAASECAVRHRGRKKNSLRYLLLASSAMFLFSASSLGQISSSTTSNGVIEFSNRRVAKSSKDKKKAEHRAAFTAPRSEGAAVRAQEYRDYVREAASLYQLPEALIFAVMKVESNFDPRAVSPANAHGLMQMIPATAERMQVMDIYSPKENILGGSRYLRILANLFQGNLELTVAGYNAGEGAVLRYGGIPPYAETQAYVRMVVDYYHRYRNGEAPH